MSDTPRTPDGRTVARFIHEWEVMDGKHGPYTTKCICNEWARRITAAILENVDAVQLYAPDGTDPRWADGFRQGWLAAKEAVSR